MNNKVLPNSRTALPLLLAIVTLLAGLTHSKQSSAATVADIWQGVLQSRNLRYVLHIAQSKHHSLTATFFSIDRASEGFPADSITLNGSEMRFSVSQVNGAFEGTLSADGNSLTGFWTQGGTSSPLEFRRATKGTRWPTDTSPHKVEFVQVAEGVSLEVLDWGGHGQPLVLLAGGGDTAHVFDRFALNFTPQHHVYGITRRGFGKSSHPLPLERNFTPQILADDVMSVIDQLHLVKPILAGHSFAGRELSTVCTDHPEKASGFVYMEAMGSYAFYSGLRGAASLPIDLKELQTELDGLKSPVGPQTKPLVQQLLQNGLPNVEKDLEDWQGNLQHLDLGSPDSLPKPVQANYEDKVISAMSAASPKFTSFNCPILAIFALDGSQTQVVQAQALERSTPSARVVRIGNAGHYVYRTNEAEVVKEMNSFMNSLAGEK
jgi:non-heme chloroperoxidase